MKDDMAVRRILAIRHLLAAAKPPRCRWGLPFGLPPFAFLLKA